MSNATKDVYLVIGGSGFLGRHIVEQLIARGDNVSVFDIVHRYDDVPFYSGDISEKEQVLSVLKRCGTTCIIHTASPQHGLKDPSLYWKVNVDGTKAVIAAAQDAGVRKLVFTSSAGVVFTGHDVVDIDERVPMPEKPFDAYNDSKAHGEAAVLAANGEKGLLTVALRPAGIFGPGDRQMMTGMYEVFQKGQTHFQIGDNNNLFDVTYVENAAYAHLLAADKLDLPPPAPPLSELPNKDDYGVENLPPLTDAERRIIGYPLSHIQLTTKPRRVPTSQARPLGPYLVPPPNAEQIETAFHDPNAPTSLPSRPVVRTRFDAMSEFAVSRAKLFNPDRSPLGVAGNAFFISNGEPIYFWDLARYIWYQLDGLFPGQRKERSPFVLPVSVGMLAAQLLEAIGWVTGRPAALTRFRVTFSAVNRWQNIEKARRVLGYEPKVSVEDGIKRMVEWFAKDVLAGNQKAAH